MLPSARTKNLVLQDLGAELLIYDLETNKALNLNETSKIIYQACRLNLPLEELKTRHKLDDEIILTALEQFRKEKLLDEDNFRLTPKSVLSRRALVGGIGASLVVFPVITSLIAPSAAMAASGAAICGNGIIEPPEECDDGNAANGDGCSATCQFEPEP